MDKVKCTITTQAARAARQNDKYDCVVANAIKEKVRGCVLSVGHYTTYMGGEWKKNWNVAYSGHNYETEAPLSRGAVRIIAAFDAGKLKTPVSFFAYIPDCVHRR